MLKCHVILYVMMIWYVIPADTLWQTKIPARKHGVKAKNDQVSQKELESKINKEDLKRHLGEHFERELSKVIKQYNDMSRKNQDGLKMMPKSGFQKIKYENNDKSIKLKSSKINYEHTEVRNGKENKDSKKIKEEEILKSHQTAWQGEGKQVGEQRQSKLKSNANTHQKRNKLRDTNKEIEIKQPSKLKNEQNDKIIPPKIEDIKKARENDKLRMAMLKTKFKKHQDGFYFKKNLIDTQHEFQTAKLHEDNINQRGNPATGVQEGIQDIADTDNEPENNISIEDLHLKRLDGFEVKVVLNQNDRDNLDYIIDLSDYRKSKDLSKIKVIRTRARNPKLTCVYLLNGNLKLESTDTCEGRNQTEELDENNSDLQHDSKQSSGLKHSKKIAARTGTSKENDLILNIATEQIETVNDWQLKNHVRGRSKDRRKVKLNVPNRNGNVSDGGVKMNYIYYEERENKKPLTRGKTIDRKFQYESTRKPQPLHIKVYAHKSYQTSTLATPSPKTEVHVIRTDYKEIDNLEKLTTTSENYHPSYPRKKKTKDTQQLRIPSHHQSSDESCGGMDIIMDADSLGEQINTYIANETHPLGNILHIDPNNVIFEQSAKHTIERLHAPCAHAKHKDSEGVTSNSAKDNQVVLNKDIDETGHSLTCTSIVKKSNNETVKNVHILNPEQLSKIVELLETLPESVIIITKPGKSNNVSMNENSLSKSDETVTRHSTCVLNDNTLGKITGKDVLYNEAFGTTSGKHIAHERIGKSPYKQTSNQGTTRSSTSDILSDELDPDGHMQNKTKFFKENTRNPQKENRYMDLNESQNQRSIQQNRSGYYYPGNIQRMLDYHHLTPPPDNIFYPHILKQNNPLQEKVFRFNKTKKKLKSVPHVKPAYDEEVDGGIDECTQNIVTYYIKPVEQHEDNKNEKRKQIRRNGRNNVNLYNREVGDTRIDYGEGGVYTSSKCEVQGNKEKLSIDCIMLKYNSPTNQTSVKPSLFCPKFMRKNKVNSVILKFRRVPTTGRLHQVTPMI